MSFRGRKSLKVEEENYRSESHVLERMIGKEQET